MTTINRHIFCDDKFRIYIPPIGTEVILGFSQHKNKLYATMVNFGFPQVDCQLASTPLCFPAVKQYGLNLGTKSRKKRLSESAQYQQAFGGIYFTET